MDIEPIAATPPEEEAEERADARTAEPAPCRQHERLDVVVEVTLSSGHNFWTGFTRNLSEGGVFVAFEPPFPEGSVLRFQFRLLPDPAYHEVLGEVRWVRPITAASEDLPAGMGVRFVDLSDALAEAIARFMAQQRDSLFFDLEEPS